MRLVNSHVLTITYFEKKNCMLIFSNQFVSLFTFQSYLYFESDFVDSRIPFEKYLSLDILILISFFMLLWFLSPLGNWWTLLLSSFLNSCEFFKQKPILSLNLSTTLFLDEILFIFIKFESRFLVVDSVRIRISGNML